MADTYLNYAALSAAQVLGVDYAIRSAGGSTGVAHIAIHGGGIEVGTLEAAKAASTNTGHAYYSFEGLKASGNSVLHITSTNFDEPTAVQLVASSSRVVSWHGAEGTTPVTYIGGLDRKMRDAIRQRLLAAGFAVVLAETDKPEIAGVNPANIANRNKSGAGVQLELSTQMRKSFFPNDDWSRSVRESGQRTTTFYNYIAAVNQGVADATAIPVGSGVPLAVGQFDLDGYTFGGDADPVTVVPGGFDPGVTGWRTQDAENPVGDNLLFGRDRLTPGTWGFNLQTNLMSGAEALAAMETITRKWRADTVRSAPGVVSTLRYNLGGNGTKRVYGRPRRIAPTISPMSFQGVTSLVADFQLVDTFFYDDAARNIDISILPGVTSGLRGPLTGRLSTLLAGEQARSVADIGGTAPAPFVAVIYGPIQNPWISEDGFKLELNTTLAYDQFAVIDTRPWANTVTRSDGASLAGALSRTSRLSTARLKPGGANFKFGGKDATGTSHCAIAWRPTYYSL